MALREDVVKAHSGVQESEKVTLGRPLGRAGWEELGREGGAADGSLSSVKVKLWRFLSMRK